MKANVFMLIMKVDSCLNYIGSLCKILTDSCQTTIKRLEVKLM